MYIKYEFTIQNFGFRIKTQIQLSFEFTRIINNKCTLDKPKIRQNLISKFESKIGPEIRSERSWDWRSDFESQRFIVGHIAQYDIKSFIFLQQTEAIMAYLSLVSPSPVDYVI